jgi:CBS domain-containing protein
VRSIKIKDYMSTQVVAFKPEDSIVAALRKLVLHGHSGGPVIDNEGKLIGIISEIDCLKEALMDGYYQQVGDRVADHMSTELDFVKQEDDIIRCADYFYKGRRRLPVLDNGKLVGVITRKDFARALINRIDHPHHGNN